MSTRIKICGITSVADAEHAIACGANYLGLIFVTASPRCVSLQTARAIARHAEGKVELVGVFKNSNPEEINAVADDARLDLVQCHGVEPVSLLNRLTRDAIKTIELGYHGGESTGHPGPESLMLAHAKKQVGVFGRAAQYLLFDRPKSMNDPRWLDHALNVFSCLSEEGVELPSFFFAGGLNGDNVSRVIETLHPFAVDVASAIEREPGIKDHEKLAQFCQNALNAKNQASPGRSN
jgi:phosphoribosylanthranilate isomerase